MPAIPLGRWQPDALELTSAVQEGEMAIEHELSDLELVKAYIELFQEGGNIHFGNDSTFIGLSSHPKAQEAFAIAFQAVHGEVIQPKTLGFIFDSIQGLHYWIRAAEDAQKALEACNGVRRKSIAAEAQS